MIRVFAILLKKQSGTIFLPVFHMNTILLATDFSQPSFTAARYACFLAEATRSALHCTHIYHPFYYSIQGEIPDMTNLPLLLKQAEAAMEIFCGKLQSLYPNLAISSSCVNSEVSDGILTEAKAIKAKLIVLGTEGLTGLSYALMGSTARSVATHSTIPVAVVPAALKKFQLRKVGFTTNFHAVEIPAMYDFSQLFEPVPEIVPIHFFAKEDVTETGQMKTWKKKADELSPSAVSAVKRLKTNSHSVGIRTFIRKEKPDALVLTRPDKPFFNRLAGRRFLRAALHQSAIPVFFIPEH